MSVEIWVDADSIPRVLRTIILRACSRCGVRTFFVADRSLEDVVKNKKAEMIVVPTAQNGADDYIVSKASESVLCITHDIPLAARMLEKGSVVINDRGMEYTKDNIGMLLSQRDVSTELRSWGVFADLTPAHKDTDTKKFADTFDKTLTKLIRKCEHEKFSGN